MSSDGRKILEINQFDMLTPSLENRSWDIYTIGDLIKSGAIKAHKDGNHGSLYPRVEDFGSEGVPFLTAKLLDSGKIDIFGAPRLTHEKADKLKLGFVLPSDVLLSHNATIGRVAVVPSYNERLLIGTSLTYFRLDEAKILPRYLAAFFNGNYFQNQLKAVMSQTTRNQVPITSQRSLKVVLPSLETQKLIADFLGAFDDRIFLLRETNTTLEAIAQTLFKSWFVDFDPVKAKAEGRLPEGMSDATAALFPSEFEESALGLIPKGWRVESVGDVMDYKEGPGIRNWQYTNSDEGTKFINIRCIQDGDLSLNSANRIQNEEANGKYIHFHLQAWDVVVSTSGTLGRSAIVRKEHLPLMLNTSVIRFRPIPERMEFCFLYQHLNSSYFLFELDAMASGSVQKNFGPMHLRKMSLVCPSFDLICRYESICKPLLQKVVDNREQIQTLTTLRDTLLPRLISGQLRLNQVQEIIDEVGA